MPDRRLEKETIQSSGAQTANSQSGVMAVAEFAEGNLYVDVTAASGTSPTLDFTVEVSHDNSNWWTHTTLTQITTTGKTLSKLTGNLGAFLRVSWTVGGTSPSFTFSLVFEGKN